MRIAIFGMGYVGVVSAACLTRDGHTVTGVDVASAKVADLNAGTSPIEEPGVAPLLKAAREFGRLWATTDPVEAVTDAEMIWICVGTPSDADGSVNLCHIKGVVQEVGKALCGMTITPLIVLRSTVPPGTTETVVVPLLEECCPALRGKAAQHVVFHPEFLRETSAIADFDAPPKLVFGENHPGVAAPLIGLYCKYEAPVFRLSLKEAEMVKYCDNLFHCTKIVFANEIGIIARSLGIDARRVAEVYCADTKLNISPKYLLPGFAYGGSCLPKDLRAMLHYSRVNSLSTPMLAALQQSNAALIETLVARVLACRPAVVGMVGLSFKLGTDDLRESPFVRVAKRLIGEGITLRVFDPGLRPARLVGSNRQAMVGTLGHLQDLLVESLADLDGSDLVLVNHPLVDTGHVLTWTGRGVRVFDLVGVVGMTHGTPGYEGIAW
jgi:GDP-mannose 6-dehydrogenase